MSVVNFVLPYWKPLVCSFFILLAICLTSQFIVLPITGLYLLGYVVIVAISATWISFVSLQNFLQQNKPFDLPKLLNLKPWPNQKDADCLKSVKQLTLDIDKYFIKKWFTYITQDESFNKESRVILEEVLTKMVNVQLNLDKEVVVHGVLNLYLKHLKEFRRSLKRREKYSGKISDLYRYSHVCSDSKKAKSYFVHQLTTNLLNHFINWELGNSLPYRILVSIVSKKVMTYILNLLSNPEFLNYYILVLSASSDKKRELNLQNYNRVRIIQVTEQGEVTPTDSVKSAEAPDTTVAVETVKTTDVVEGKDPPQDEVTKPARIYPEIKSEDVKIYEPRSCKTWYDSLDLTSIPLGQDILDTISLSESDKDVDVTYSATLQDADKDDVLSPMSSAKTLFDEVKNIRSFEGLKTSIKPISDATATTLHNIKDFQESTVNSVVKPVSQVTSTALHRIGGLHLQDEAAGVVEGILDFGRTRIRKGLRLTGLQDELVKNAQKKQITKMTRVEDVEPENEPRIDVLRIPSIQTQDEGSPDPEYEETADLATSIAKLRSLLEQKSSESNLSTPALSPMPSDELTGKILLEDVDETDGMMPSFYKTWAKTATGVIHNTLNTIKTALPGNAADCDRYDATDKWLFVEANVKDADLAERMDKLLSERKIFCTVDTAYEAIDSLSSLQQTDRLRQASIQFEDELDDFEVKLPVTKALFDIVCELIADNKETFLIQEPIIKSILLLFGNYIEQTIINRTEHYLQYSCANAKIPSESKGETLSLEMDEFVDLVLSSIPDYIKYILGEKTIQDATHLFILSLQVQKINQDLVMQIFEIVCMKLMDGSKQLSPISA